MCNVRIFFVFTILWIADFGHCDIADCIENWPVQMPKNVRDVDTSLLMVSLNNILPDELEIVKFSSDLSITDGTKPVDYFKISKSDDGLYVNLETTEDILKVDSDVTSIITGGQYAITTFRVEFICRGESVEASTFIFVDDTNNNDPTFSNNEKYQISAPMPIMTGSDFTIYSDEPIEATDLDFTNSDITFTISPDDFEVSSNKISEKTFRPSFKAKKPITYTEDTTLTLTATDAGDPSRSKSVDIVISPDSTSLDVPSFSSSSYSFNYSIDSEGKPNLTPALEIRAVTKKKEEIDNIILEGDYKDCCFNDPTQVDGLFEISFKNVLPEGVTSLVTMTLRYDTDYTAQTAIVISIEQDVPSFLSTSYKFSYSVDQTDGPILTASDGQEIEVVSNKLNAITNVGFEGDYVSIFNTPQLTGNKFTISLTDPLPPDAPPLVTMTLKYDTDNTARTAIVITVPARDLSFNQSYYTGSYDSTMGDFQMDADINIVTSLTGTLEVDVTGDYSEKFEVVCAEYVCKVSLLQLEISDLEKNEIIFNIEAKIDETVATSVVVISLVKNAETPLKFSEISYSADYNISSDGQWVVSKIEIELLNLKDPVSTVIHLDAKYDGYFSVTLNPETSKWELEKIIDLPNDVVTSNDQLTTILTASDATDSKAQSILIIRMPNLESPKFAADHYEAQYLTVEGETTATVEFNEDIDFSSGDSNNIDIVCDATYCNDYFELAFESERWFVKVNNNLGPDILNSNTNLVISLTAKDKTYEFLTDNAFLVIDLPALDADVPQFSEILYTARYTIEGGEHEISDTNIQAASKSDPNLDVTIKADDLYSSYFEMAEEGDHYKLAKTGNLDNVTINEQISINITAQATLNGVTAFAPIVINLPKNVEPLDAAFDKVLYNGSIDRNGKLHIFDDIQVITEKEDDSISVTPSNPEFAKYFSISYEGGKVAVSYSDVSIPEDTLKKISLIPLELILSVEESDEKTSSVLNIAVENSEIKFSEISYSADYIVGSDGEGTISEINIELLNVEDPDSTVIHLDDKYDEYFSVTLNPDTSIWELKKIIDLPNNVLTSNDQLRTILTASDAADSTAQSILTIRMPNLESPKFAADHYQAQYLIVEGETMATVKLNEDIGFSSGDSNNIDILCDETFCNAYFELVFESEKWSVKVNRNLGTDILNSNLNLVISLTAKDKTYEFLCDNAFLVINLPSLDIEAVPEFSEILYTANYTLDGGEHKLTDTIIKATSKSDANLEVTLKSDDLYSSYFEMIPEGDDYKLAKIGNLDDKIINEEISIFVTAQAASNGVTAFAPIVINLPRKVEPVDVAFDKVLYNGYIDKNGHLQISDNIKVFTEKEDDAISATKSNPEFEQYFSVFYEDGEVSVTYSDVKIPEGTLKKITLIPLELILSVKGSNEKTSCVLNIAVKYSATIDDDDDDDVETNNIGYIAAISVLTVLLVGFLTGSLLLWYFKFRSRSFATLEEDIDIEDKRASRFEKNQKEIVPEPMPVEKRRPTGFVFNPLVVDETEDDDEDRTSLESEKAAVEKEKPKSVAFDDVVEEMHIDFHGDSEASEDEEGHYSQVENEEKVDISGTDNEESRL